MSLDLVAHDGRSELELASTPMAVRAVQAKAEAMRAMLEKALEIAGDEAPHLAALKREAEELALNAMLKLGSMCPPPALGVGRGQKVATVATFSEEAGITRSTARNYRALHEAMQSCPEQFERIVTSALESGKPVPLGLLRRLLVDETVGQDPLPRPVFWLDPACKAADRARSVCLDISNNEEAPDDVRIAARDFADGVSVFCNKLRQALNRENSQ